MILILFVLAALGFFYHRVLDTHGRARTIGSWATGLVIVISVCAIAANDAWHFGMHEATTTTSTALVGKTVVKHVIGTNGKVAAYGYTTAAGQQKAVPSLTTTTKLNRGASTATLITRTTRLKFNSKFAAVMYAGSGLDGKLIAKHITLNLPTSWQIVNK
ncbi:DUF4811 domain-containing protein [Lacticaseibacillus porcinae]|uniref:DUF4811 domain-containing protein n=1 Tax=Lacticaseibacillus porcinae TaxID=1123687 RepID=UPI000F7ABFC8|nr:DUF4811 domain-containing protein [Lacticaseibacillus porcinae]